jgi:hypothetical protein
MRHVTAQSHCKTHTGSRHNPWLRLSIALIAGTASVAAVAQTAFTSTYKISGAEPTAAGKYPVYIHIVGTGETFNGDLAMTQDNAMAAKGFVAATVEYSSGSFGSCSAISTKTKCRTG